MRPRFAAVGLWLIASATAPAVAQDPDLRSLFPQRAPVVAEATEGLIRLELPAAVIGACRSDLSDLRLIDDAGRQVPYLLDAGRRAPGGSAPGGDDLELRRTLEAPVLELFRERFGERQRRWRERFVLGAPGADPVGRSWDLELISDRERFVTRVQVESVAADGTRRTLVDEASVFRLERQAGQQRPQRQRLRVPLPSTSAPRLEVTLESQEGGYLEPSFRYRSSRSLRGPGQISVPLRTLASGDEQGATVIELERPSGLVPEALQLETATSTFQRQVEIRDEGGAAGGELLGASQLFRLETSLVLEEMTVDLLRARGSRLVVRIDDGDSPGLEELAFTAILRRPSILFAASDRSLSLYFGGARAHRPLYDIASLLRSPPVAGVRAELAAELYDQAINADLGPIEANPRHDRSPPLAFAMRPGAEIDTRAYSHRRSLEIPSSEQGSKHGLARYTLDVDDLALLRADLADLRVVDGQSRQWAYLLRRAGSEVEAALVTQRESQDRQSIYALELPVSPVVLTGVVLDVDAAFFDRPFSLEGRPAPPGGKSGRGSRQSGWVSLDAGRLQRQAPRRSSLRLDVAPRRITELRLSVEDGDDSPLELTVVRGRFRLAELFVAAPEGSYALLLGHPDDRPPSYELERVRELVMALDSVPTTSGPLGPNQEFSAAARSGAGQDAQRYLLWGAIGVAVVGLTLLTLRLARSEGA